MASRSICELQTAMTALLGDDSTAHPDPLLLEDVAALLKLLRQIDGVLASKLQVIDRRHATTAECGRTTRGWMVEEQLLSPREAEAKLRVARAGVARPAVIEAMRDGEISHKHAELITNFLPKLDADARDEAERELVKAARVTDPGTLNRGLRELQDKLNLDETAEERAVRQYEGRWLKTTETFNGMTRLVAMLGPVEAAIVHAAITSLSGRTGEADDRHIGQRRADAVTTNTTGHEAAEQTSTTASISAHITTG